MNSCEIEKPTRRAAFGTAGTGFLFFWAGRFAMAASDFWNRKQPSAWSNDEIEQLTTRSPWAKEINAEFMRDADYTTGGADGPQIGTGGVISAPRSQSGGSFEMGGGDARASRGGARREPVTVRWESAQPILDALVVPLKSELKGRYAISVSNLPAGVMESRRVQSSGKLEEDSAPAALQRRMIEGLKGGATLEVRGKEPEQAGVVTSGPVAGTYLFGFSKEFLTIGPNDKDILFTLQTGLMTVKAKFQPKEMMYRGKLAL
jgi:hypothetical protein